MGKQDYVWAATKIFGIYLIILAIIAIPGLIGYGIQMGGFDTKTEVIIQQDQIAKGSNAIDFKNVAEEMRLNAISMFIPNLSKVILFSIIGFYFFCSGKLIFKLINLREYEGVDSQESAKKVSQ
jgi:hypothetical protein